MTSFQRVIIVSRLGVALSQLLHFEFWLRRELFGSDSECVLQSEPSWQLLRSGTALGDGRLPSLPTEMAMPPVRLPLRLPSAGGESRCLGGNRLQATPVLESSEGDALSVSERMQQTAGVLDPAERRQDSTLQHRLLLWTAAISMVRKSPVLGVGPRGYAQPTGNCCPNCVQLHSFTGSARVHNSTGHDLHTTRSCTSPLRQGF